MHSISRTRGGNARADDDRLLAVITAKDRFASGLLQRVEHAEAGGDVERDKAHGAEAGGPGAPALRSRPPRPFCVHPDGFASRPH